MSIGKWAIALFLITLMAFSMLSIFTIIKQNQSTDAIYVASTNDAINRSVNQTEMAIGTGINFLSPMILIVAILFLLASFLMFRKRW